MASLKSFLWTVAFAPLIAVAAPTLTVDLSLLPPALGFSEYFVPPVLTARQAVFENGMTLAVSAEGAVEVTGPENAFRYRTKEFPATVRNDGQVPAWTLSGLSVDYNGVVLSYVSGAATMKRIFKAGRLGLDGRTYVGFSIATKLTGAKLSAPCDPLVCPDVGTVVRTSSAEVSLEMPTGVDRPDEAEARWFWWSKGAPRGDNEHLALVQYVRKILRGRYNRRDVNPFPGDAAVAAAQNPEAWRLCRRRPFVRETPFATVWTGVDGGAVFFTRDAEDVKVELPRGWTLRGFPDGRIHRAKAGDVVLAGNGDFK